MSIHMCITQLKCAVCYTSKYVTFHTVHTVLTCHVNALTQSETHVVCVCVCVRERDRETERETVCLVLF